MKFVFYFHLLGATVWVGGLIVVGAIIPAVRKATEDRSIIRAIARRFGLVSWIALGVLVLTGTMLSIDRWSQTLIMKLGLVLVVAMLAGWHSVMAGDQSPAVRGGIQGSILVLSLLILLAAINL